jgi:hypothetical protein
MSMLVMYLKPQCMHTAESQEDYVYTRKGFAVEHEILEGSQPQPGTPRHFLRCAQKGSSSKTKGGKSRDWCEHFQGCLGIMHEESIGTCSFVAKIAEGIYKISMAYSIIHIEDSFSYIINKEIDEVLMAMKICHLAKVKCVQ